MTDSTIGTIIVILVILAIVIAATSILMNWLYPPVLEGWWPSCARRSAGREE